MDGRGRTARLRVRSVMMAVLAMAASASGATELAYKDIDGVWNRYEAGSRSPSVLQARVVELVSTPNIDFQVNYIDVGIGFDDPVLGAVRRSTAREVLEYIGTVLVFGGPQIVSWIRGLFGV